MQVEEDVGVLAGAVDSTREECGCSISRYATQRLRGILSNRQTAVSTAGNYRCDGVSPPLFLLDINDLELTDQNNKAVFIFAHNIFLFDSHPSKVLAEAIMQEAITKVTD